MSDNEYNASGKNSKKYKLWRNILEFQKDLIKEDNNKNKVEVMTTNKEEKYQKIIYISYKYFSNTIIIFWNN